MLVATPHVVEGLNVINGPKCNKVLNVIKFCPKCNKVLNVITICPKCNKLLSCQLGYLKDSNAAAHSVDTGVS